MERTYEDLTKTERILFDQMKKVQKDRMEHQTAACYSTGSKQREHRVKRAACANKEMALETVLEKAGLWELYRSWCGLYVSEEYV